MQILFICNDTSYGSERSYNTLRFAKALSKRECETARLFSKRRNPTLAMARATFIVQLTQEIPPQSAEMDAMVRFNLGLRS